MYTLIQSKLNMNASLAFQSINETNFMSLLYMELKSLILNCYVLALAREDIKTIQLYANHLTDTEDDKI